MFGFLYYKISYLCACIRMSLGAQEFQMLNKNVLQKFTFNNKYKLNNHVTDVRIQNFE